MKVRAGIAFFMAMLGSLQAADTVATVTSTGPVVIGRTHVDLSKAPSMVLVDGDELGTLKHSASVSFSDQSRAVLHNNSAMRVGLDGKKIVVHLSSGGAHFSTVGPQLTLFVSGKPMALPKGVFTVTADSKIVKEGEKDKYEDKDKRQKKDDNLSPYRP